MVHKPCWSSTLGYGKCPNLVIHLVLLARMMYAGVPFVLDLGLEDTDAPTFCVLLYARRTYKSLPLPVFEEYSSNISPSDGSRCEGRRAGTCGWQLAANARSTLLAMFAPHQQHELHLLLPFQHSAAAEPEQTSLPEQAGSRPGILCPVLALVKCSIRRKAAFWQGLAVSAKWPRSYPWH